MLDMTAFLDGLGGILAAGLVTWAISLAKRDVSIIDSLWSLLFVLAAGLYLATAPAPGSTSILVLMLVGLWAFRLAVYITWRNWGADEDRRYRHLRERHQPRFAYKSLYLVLLEQDISDRRPADRAYIQRTNAFLPGPPRAPESANHPREVRL